MKKTTLLSGALCLALLAFLLSIPLVNNRVAAKTAERIQEIALPKETEYIESFSKAGKLVGNGNGMQYLGGILIRSRLPQETLQAYYVRRGRDYAVERQTGQQIPFVEHGTLTLRTTPDGDGYYIVYAWGTGPFLFQELDLRGH